MSVSESTVKSVSLSQLCSQSVGQRVSLERQSDGQQINCAISVSRESAVQSMSINESAVQSTCRSASQPWSQSISRSTSQPCNKCQSMIQLCNKCQSAIHLCNKSQWVSLASSVSQSQHCNMRQNQQCNQCQWETAVKSASFRDNRAMCQSRSQQRNQCQSPV